MKRVLIAIIISLLLSISIYSQTVYFDIGFGVGRAKTEIGGVDVGEALGSGVRDTGVEVSLKLGVGPLFNIPMYIVGEWGGIGHRFEDSMNYLQLNSYLLGPGLVFYPAPFIQLGGSFGHSYVANQTDLPMILYRSVGGYAGNIYVAVDLGKKNHGCLIGLKYTATRNTFEVSGALQESNLVCFFIKYAYRDKIRHTGADA